jgi:hypothetical protein
MTLKQTTDHGSPAGAAPRRHQVPFESAVQSAMHRGFVIGREVLVGKVPGVVVGYNIGGFGRFVGAIYPLVIRTAMGITKCSPDEVELIG